MASREGFDIFNSGGRRHIWRRLRRGKLPPRYFWGDSFGRFVCMVRGHRVVHYKMENTSACHTCHQWLREDTNGSE